MTDPDLRGGAYYDTDSHLLRGVLNGLVLTGALALVVVAFTALLVTLTAGTPAQHPGRSGSGHSSPSSGSSAAP